MAKKIKFAKVFAGLVLVWVILGTMVLLVSWGDISAGLYGRAMGGFCAGVVSFLVLCGIYYEIKERRNKRSKGEYAPQEVKWFFRWAEWTFPLSFVVICIAGIIAYESMK